MLAPFESVTVPTSEVVVAICPKTRMDSSSERKPTQENRKAVMMPLLKKSKALESVYTTRRRIPARQAISLRYHRLDLGDSGQYNSAMRKFAVSIAILLSIATLAFGQSGTKRYLYMSMPDGAQKEGRSDPPGIMI